MRLIPFAAAAGMLACAAPAFADTAKPDTLKEVTTRGVVMTVQGIDIPIAYKPDGSFTVEVQGQTMQGKWRIDGAKLCTTSSLSPNERCTEYPAGKASGDTFEIQGAMGPAQIRIN
jgi:hypothetical protein